jgi:cytochrome oxidase Cu insertion factor (SCO1/SenC/PrrC family)
MSSKPALKYLIWGVVGISLTGVWAAINSRDCGKSCCAPRAGESVLPVMFALPDFSLTERSGQTVTLASLTGKVWVADFIFTTCPGPCPIMTSKMAQLHNDFADTDIQFVTITVDPVHDTPAKLKEYAGQYQADPRRWWFLTGKVDQIYDLSVKGFRLAAQTQTVPSDDHPILHSTRFVLVDRQGRIRGYYEGTDTAALQKLRKQAQQLLKEPPRD